MEDLVVTQKVHLTARDALHQGVTGISAREGETVVLAARLTDDDGMERPIARYTLVWYLGDRQIELEPVAEPEAGDYVDYTVSRRVVVSPYSEGLYWVEVVGQDGSRLTSNAVKVALRRPAAPAPVSRATRSPIAALDAARIPLWALLLGLIAMFVVAWFGRGLWESRGLQGSTPGLSSPQTQPLPGVSSAVSVAGPGGTGGGTAVGTAGGPTAANGEDGRPGAARTAPPPFTVRYSARR